MSISAIAHISNQEPVLCDLDEMPKPSDTILTMINPRRRDGQDLDFLEEGVTTLLWPWTGII